jgi:hypothetical protein
MIMEHFNALSLYLYEGTKYNYKILSVYVLFFHQYYLQEKQNYTTDYNVKTDNFEGSARNINPRNPDRA